MSAKAPPRVARRPRVTELDKVIGERLRARRLLLQLSQSDLAEQLGCTFQQVQKYENGTNRVSAATLSRIAALLGAPLAYFFNAPEALPAQAPASITLDRQSAELLRAYRSIPDNELRRQLLALVRELAATGTAG